MMKCNFVVACISFHNAISRYMDAWKSFTFQVAAQITM